jgi:hypothetical protein
VPVSVATTEQSFSKLRLIKSYLKSTMSQEWLNGRAHIVTGRKTTRFLDIEELVAKFSKQKARKIKI